LQRLSQHTSRADSIVSGVAAVGGALDPGGNVAADIAVLPVYAVLYYRLDFRNSTSQMQLPNGQYIAWSGYEEWGATTSPTDHDMNMAGVDPIQFGSYNFDRILGLYYAQRRWYDGTARRFTQPDPKWHTGISGGNSIWGDNPTRMPNAGLLPDIHAILQSTNLYAYCMNNPINFIDPRGLSAEDFGGGNHTVKGPLPLRPQLPPPPQPSDNASLTGGASAHLNQNSFMGSTSPPPPQAPQPIPSPPPQAPLQAPTIDLRPDSNRPSQYIGAQPFSPTPQQAPQTNNATDRVLRTAGARLPTNTMEHFETTGCDRTLTTGGVTNVTNPQAGDLFSNTTDVARALYLMYDPNDWLEWGAWIYIISAVTSGTPIETFTAATFGYPFLGAHDNVIAGMILNSSVNVPVDVDAFPSPVTEVVTVRVAMFHTHPNCNCHDGNHFSNPDIAFSNIANITMYVATPDRGLLRHSPGGPATMVR